MDYLEAITQRSVTILLNGAELVVRRANLGSHYRLSIILDEWQEARRKKEHHKASELTLAYVALATGLDIKAIETSGISEVMFAFTMLMRLNQAQDDLPFMQIKRRGRREEYEYDYPHRALADWVARLANHYAWTSKYILEQLTPEEAICYMQEMLLQDYEDKEFIYRLSEVAYTYDKGSKKARLVPFPKPSWMAKKLPTVRIPKSIAAKWYPQGNVIEAGDIGRGAD